MDPDPRVYHLILESAKKRSFIIDSEIFFLFFHFLGQFFRFFEVFDPPET